MSDADGRGRPFAYAINREDCGLLEWGREKCARRVRLMVLREEQLPLVAAEPRAGPVKPRLADL